MRYALAATRDCVIAVLRYGFSCPQATFRFGLARMVWRKAWHAVPK
jgi:hypothetical protein